MKLLAGIDGGGTRTRLCCRTLEGEPLCRKEFGPFNINSIGEERFRTLLGEMTDYLTEQGQCQALCIGAAGVSNFRMQELVALTMERAGIDRWKLVGDQEIALYGALEGGPGLALIAGTGSVCIGRNADGTVVQAGGWGHLIGDGGSAYAIGRDALAAVVCQCDGCGEDTLLTELAEKKLGLGNRARMVEYVYGGDKSRIAAAACLVEEAAACDTVAQEILSRNAASLVALIGAVAGRLGMEKGEVALLGGLLEHDTTLRRILVKQLETTLPGIRAITPRQDACTGAVMMAQAMLEE